MPFAGDGGKQIFVHLLAAATAQYVAWPGHQHLQTIAGPAQLALHQRGIESAQAPAPQVSRHIDRIEPQFDRPGADLRGQIVRNVVGLFNQVFMRVKLGLNELSDRFDQHFLFLGKGKMHGSL